MDRVGLRKSTRCSCLSAPVREATAPHVLREAKGFVLTGRELIAAEAHARIWKEPREPLPIETSVPGSKGARGLCSRPLP